MSEPDAMLSQRQQDIRAIEHAAHLAAPLAEPGHIFSHRWVNEALDLPPQPFSGEARDNWNIRRGGLVAEWGAALRRLHGIHVENVRSRGYIVIDPRQTQHVAVAIVSRSVKKELALAAEKIMYTSADGLSDGDIRARHDALAWLGKIEMVRANQRPRPPRRPRLRAVTPDDDDNKHDNETA